MQYVDKGMISEEGFIFLIFNAKCISFICCSWLLYEYMLQLNYKFLNLLVSVVFNCKSSQKKQFDLHLIEKQEISLFMVKFLFVQ